MNKVSVTVKKSSPLAKHYSSKTDSQQKLEDISKELDDLTEMFLGSNRRLMDQIEKIQRMI